MAEIKVKSNGLRNELKNIHKAIDNLTNVLEHFLAIQGDILDKQANQHENIKVNWSDCPLYDKLHKQLCECGKEFCDC